MPARNVDVTVRGKNEAGAAFRGAAKDAETFGGRIKALFTPLNALKGLVAGVIGSAIGGFIKKSVDAANESEAAMARVESAVTNVGLTFNRFKDDLDRVFTAIQKTTRFSDDDAADAFARLLSITQDYTGSVKNLTLAANIAAAKKIDLVTAAELVGKAAIGETGALKKQGIVIRDNVDAITELSARFNGFAARDAATMQGQLHQVANAWDNVLESIGRTVLGLSGATTTAGGLSTKLNDLAKWIDENRTGLSDVSGSLTDIVKTLGDLANITIVDPLKALAMGRRMDKGDTSLEDYQTLSKPGYTLERIGVGLGQAAAGAVGYEPDEDAGKNTAYYTALDAIKKRRAQEKAKELAASEAMAREEGLKRWYDDHKSEVADTEKKLGKIRAEAALDAMPKVGVTLGDGAPPQLRQATEADAKASEGAVQDAMAEGMQALQDARDAVFDVGDALDRVKTGSLMNFADTWVDALGQIVAGTKNAGTKIAQAFGRAIGGAAIAEGKANILSALAMAVKGIFDPSGFTAGAALKLFGLGTAEVALGAAIAGGGFGGGAGGYGGGGGGGALGSTSFAAQQSQEGTRGGVTFIIDGKEYDTSDPRVEESLANALRDLLGRKVVIIPTGG